MNFTIPAIDYTTFGESGSTTVRVSVAGFWATPVEIYVRRKQRFDRPVEWTVDVTHSSGGYEDASTLDRLEVESNFAHAILAAIDVAKEIKSKSDILEANFQARRKVDEEYEAQRQAMLKAKIDSDAQITKEQIDQLLKDLALGTELRAYNRGSDEYYNVFEKSFSTGRIYFTRFGKKQNISIAELRALLADKSARSCIVKKV